MTAEEARILASCFREANADWWCLDLERADVMCKRYASASGIRCIKTSTPR